MATPLQNPKPECLTEEKERLLRIIHLIDEIENLYREQSQSFKVELGLGRVEQRLECLLHVLQEKSDQIVTKAKIQGSQSEQEAFICLNFLSHFRKRGLISQLKYRPKDD